ncbi:MAG TPA: TolC family protein, partial [Polyangiaceae bacterium]|nr:TolC family protein [Polyangiaceae bacterium]
MAPRTVPLALVSAAWLTLAAPVRAQEARVSMADALRAAQRVAPELVVARAREGVARADVGVAGAYPANPSFAAGTSTQTARFSGTLSVPLILLGQRGAAVDAARADEATVLLDTQVAWNDVRQATEHAYVALWLAEGVAGARRDAAILEGRLEDAVIQRVQVGAAPELEALRVRAERARAEADVIDANAEIVVASADLSRWMAATDGAALRASEDPPVPETLPPLDVLAARIDLSSPVRRERSDERAANVRADRERALARPALSLDLGADVDDPTLRPADNPGATPPVNWRAQVTVELPLFNRRGANVDRERAAGEVARSRAVAARVRALADLTAAYRAYEAAGARQRVLRETVVPAAEGAAKASEEAYALGRAQLFAVLDAERVVVDAHVTALQ